jgi:uncharacterized membrane protein (UPF0127 family)
MILIHKESNTVLANDMRVCRTFIERSRGLMFRKKFLGDGLLLEPCNSIHNCFVRFPIDAIFVDGNFKIIKILKDFKPWRFSLIYFKASRVIELPGGSLPEIVKKDDFLEVQGV